MNLGDFLNRYVEFPKLPEAMVRARVLEILQDLCTKTWVYSEVFTLLTTAGTSEYTLTPSVSTDEVLAVFEKEVQAATVNTPQPTAAAATAGAGTLTNGTTYSYKVTATKDDYGETLPCAAVSAVATATGTINLTWDSIDGADGYNVYRLDGAVYGFMDDVTTASYTDDGTDTPDTDVTPPTESNLMREISLASPAGLGKRNTTWRHREGDTVSQIVYDGAKTIRTVPVPSESGIGVQMRIALKPTSREKDAELPTVFERHLDLIDEGVRWKLHLTPGSKDHPWADTQLGAYHRGVYLAGRSLLKNARMFGYGGPVTAMPRRGRSPWF